MIILLSCTINYYDLLWIFNYRTDLFQEQVRLHPEHAAIVAENGCLSYAEPDRLSEKLAAALLEKEGIQPDEFIAVRMGRVKEFHVALLAIHKVGAAYMPIDLEYPPERVAYLMEDSGARLTLTEQIVAELLKEDRTIADLAGRRGPERRAYMIYTSGSTGKPKGVVLPQRALTNLVHFSQSAGDRDRTAALRGIQTMPSTPPWRALSRR